MMFLENVDEKKSIEESLKKKKIKRGNIRKKAELLDKNRIDIKSRFGNPIYYL